MFGRFRSGAAGGYRRVAYVFLANGSPVDQLKVLDQCPGAALVVADTMDH